MSTHTPHDAPDTREWDARGTRVPLLLPEIHPTGRSGLRSHDTRVTDLCCPKYGGPYAHATRSEMVLLNKSKQPGYILFPPGCAGISTDLYPEAHGTELA